MVLACGALPGSTTRCSSGPPPGRVCAIAAPAPADWRLVASGTRLQDGLGRTVFLRGFNAGERSKFAPYMPFDYADAADFPVQLGKYMDRAQSWGTDAMRVPFTWAALEPVQGQDDQDWLSRYDQLLDSAWAHGIWTVVDFHQDIYTEAYCGDGFPAWTVANPPAPHHDCPQWSLQYFNDPNVIAAFDAFWANTGGVQDLYAAAWDRMVARYKDKPGVLGFEPINEPSSGSADNDTFSATTLADFYSKMVARMRAAAPSSLVFVDPTGFDGVSAMTKLVRPTGDGIVFAPHYYPLTANPDAVLPGQQRWSDVGAQWNVPVFIGEFGASNLLASTPAYMAGHYAGFDALGLSGTEWEYGVAVELWNSESDSVVLADGTETPIVAQAILRPYARAIAGANVTQSWGPAAGATSTANVYALSFVPAGGVSEVAFPARAFTSGYDVELEGGCYDVTTVPGRMLLQPDPGATTVSLHVTAH